MSRNHPTRFTEAPVDPRTRRVVLATQKTKAQWLLELECGHWALRRYAFGAPSSIVCTECPAAGGLGGHIFQPQQPK